MAGFCVLDWIIYRDLLRGHPALGKIQSCLVDSVCLDGNGILSQRTLLSEILMAQCGLCFFLRPAFPILCVWDVRRRFSGFLVSDTTCFYKCDQKNPGHFFGNYFDLTCDCGLADSIHRAAAERKFITVGWRSNGISPENVIPKILNQAAAKYTNAPIFVMSEYTLEGGVPDSLKDWCREHSRYLVIGGKDIVTNDVYYDTAFVVGTNGQVIFKQAKCVPIQLFKDGLRATGQKLWDSPWGKIGICICYDLSYTRVTDELVRQGAQMFIIPTMDVEGWGMHEHELHSRVAPTRAAEYDIPIFRVASSGISQAVTRGGKMIAHLPVPDNGAIFSAQLELPMRASLPLDRYFAPVCVAVTGTVTAILLFLTWKGNRRKQNASVA